uniref:Uncharacterized protein n=1 Tax=Anguilla anguilla TaxID=7936 RepID=A0A0E9V1P5_ANGAN
MVIQQQQYWIGCI